MMTVGTPVSANGAEAYFKADFIKQEMLLKKSADENDETDENIPIGKIAGAEEAVSILKKPEAEDSDGENSTALKENLTALENENAVAESDPILKSGGEETPAKDLAGKNSAAEYPAVKNLSIEPPVTENSGVENPIVENPKTKDADKGNVKPSVENPSIENPSTEHSDVKNSIVKTPVIEQSKFDEERINFAQMRTRWVGKLSEELELTGEVSDKEFAALARGVHPQTGEQFIRHVKPRTVTDDKGKTHQTKSHRAGLDQTLNAPKSVSLVASYDERVIAAHWRSAIKAIEAIEEFTTAKMGNVKPPERTGKAAYAAFLHFEARPDFKSNYAAPDLHTHFFEFNVARTADGRHRALETREVYRCQKLATAVYRSELFKEMTAIGYEMRIDTKTGAPEIASISRDYIEASSPRQTEIKRTAEELGIKSTKIVASNYRRGKNFDPVEMRDRWREMDEKFGSQAANAAVQARHQTLIIRSEKQMLSPQKQISDLPNMAETTDMKAAAAVDFVIAQAKEQKDIEVSKRKWITRQTLLTEALNYSPADLTIERVKAEFSEREKNGEFKELELDRRKTKIQAQRENQNAEEVSSVPIVSERVVKEGLTKSAEPASVINLEDANVGDQRLTDQHKETLRAEPKTAIEDSILKAVIQNPVIEEQVIKTGPAVTARLEIPALEGEIAVQESFSELPPVPRINRKDFAGEEKSATRASSNSEPPNPVTLPEKIETNHRETSEIKLEITQNSEESFENIYDKTGILQSRTRTSGSRNGENQIIADYTNGAEHNDRIFHDGRFGNGDNTSESNAINPISGDTAIGHTAFGGSTGTGESGSNITDYGAEHHRENNDSANETRTGAEQNSLAGRRERELSNRSGSVGSGKSDNRRIIRGDVEKSENGGESNKTSFKPIESVENAVKAKTDFQPKTSEMETTPRLESDAGVEKVKIAGAKSTALRDHRTDDQAARGGHEITGNDRADLSAIERDGAEDTGVDAESERGIDRREKRDEESENRNRKTEGGAATSRTVGEFGTTGIEDGNQRTGTVSSQSGELQVANGGGLEGEGFAVIRISDGDQRATGKRTSTSTEPISEIEGADRFDSATNSGSEGSGNYERTESREKSRVDGSHTEVVNRAVNFSDAGNGMLLWNEQGFERESSSTTTNDGRITAKIIDSAGSQNEDGRKFQQYGDNVSTNVTGSRKILQSAAGGADEDRPGSLETRRRTAEKTAQIINIKRFSGGLDSQIVAEWTSIIEKSDAADFLNELVKPKSQTEEQQLCGHLDAQAALIAIQLKLAKPEPEAKPNVLKLAVALTEIEVANYEQASNDPVSDKVFEVLVKDNMHRAAAPPQADQIEHLRKTLSGEVVESTLKPSSDLEAEALNALLDSVKYGFDASAVIRARQSVSTNEVAAQATATLVQIAYGGQMNAFTANFKNDLVEQIYYAPTPAIDVYQDFRQFDWRQTIENFAPTVNNLAEQYKVEIKLPDTDLERNKLLADFTAQQLVEAYESQNSPMEKYVQNQLTANILRAGSLEVSQPQKNTIDALTDQNLEPPKFSSALEANASITAKYDEAQKAAQAIRLADQIREAAQIKAEKHAAMEMETERVQVLTM